MGAKWDLYSCVEGLRISITCGSRSVAAVLFWLFKGSGSRSLGDLDPLPLFCSGVYRVADQDHLRISIRCRCYIRFTYPSTKRYGTPVGVSCGSLLLAFRFVSLTYAAAVALLVLERMSAAYEKKPGWGEAPVALAWDRRGCPGVSPRFSLTRRNREKWEEVVSDNLAGRTGGGFVFSRRCFLIYSPVVVIPPLFGSRWGVVGILPARYYNRRRKKKTPWRRSLVCSPVCLGPALEVVPCLKV